MSINWDDIRFKTEYKNSWLARQRLFRIILNFVNYDYLFESAMNVPIQRRGIHGSWSYGLHRNWNELSHKI